MSRRRRSLGCGVGLREEPDAPEPLRAILVPSLSHYVCPSCHDATEPEVCMEEDISGEWRVPDEERFVRCPSCGAHLDIGWSGWRHHEGCAPCRKKLEKDTDWPEVA